jgi:RNA polymerase sigma-70 factor (ECF subfamily)
MTVEEELNAIVKSKKDSSAFKPLYYKYYSQIFGYVAKKVSDESVAKELTSNVFFKAITKINQFQPSGHSISSWLYKIALNEIRMHFRKVKQEQYLFHTETLVEPLQLFETSMDNEMLEVLERLLLRQKESDLMLLELRFYQGMRFEEIAKTLGISYENAKKKTYRLLARLRTELTVIV